MDSDKANREDQPLADVDRIRDIIFGPQMRLYEQQFQRMVGQLDSLAAQVEELSASLEQQRAEQDALTREAQENTRQQLAEAQAQRAALRQEFSSRAERQEAETRKQMGQLAADLRKLGQDIRSELSIALNALEDDKASRQTVGDLLIEMGTRLKRQMGIADLLGQLEESAEAQPSD